MRTGVKASEYSAALAKEIRRRRLAAGLSQNKLAALAGVSRTMLTHVEREMRLPTVEMLFRIAAGLGTTPAVVLATVEREALAL
jgi:transcriptional regulator with XRE-family HTH domain